MQNKINSLRDYAQGKKYHIITYGCQMNEHDSEKLAGILSQIGYTYASDMNEADFIIFNTCCVREGAEARVFGNVGALKQRKRKNKNLIVAVCGCMMQQKAVSEKLFKTFPFVSIVFGTGNMHRLPEMLYSAAILKKRQLVVEDDSKNIVEDIPVNRNSGPLSYVNIMFGCDNFCSYCIVPYVRGREKSRKAEDIVKEVKGLVAQGYKEVMLLGQNVNSYGKEENVSFAELLTMVAKTGIDRIRFMTSHPKDISDELIDVIAANDNICNQVHLPVQSGSNRILNAMNRGYTREYYLGLIEKIRAKIPGAMITTDIIVGFPGETEEDFLDTLSLVEQVKFDAAFTFVYSLRTGTKAAQMEGHLSEEIKSERIVRLIEKQSEITYESNKKYVGNLETVLVESVSKRDDGCVCGRTDSGKMVNFAGDADLIGKFVSVKIVNAKKTTLYGELKK